MSKGEPKAVKALIIKHEKQRNKQRTGKFTKDVVIPAASLMNRLRRRQRDW